MTQMMNAAVVRGFGQPLSFDEIPVPAPGPNEVLVKIMASGICHTDLHAANGDWPVKPTPPFVPGHEGAGIVARVGAGVTHLKEGDAVGIAWLHDACGRCEHCITGWETLCESQNMSGYTVNGSFAEYAIGHADYVARLPDKVDFMSIAPILCAGITTYKGLKETETKPGEWVAISGVGGLGHVAIQYAKAMGLHVAALDVMPDKLALAHDLGADVAINAAEDTAVEQVIDETRGGAHGVLVTAVSVPAFNQALSLVRRRGTIALNGLPPGDFKTPIFDVVLKRLTIRGSIVGTRKDMEEAIAFAADGQVRPHIHETRLDRVNDVFAELEAGKVDGRMVIRMS
ncbi:alcohol dehydrogenase [Salinisphaera hydrothermalis C41B8]|uniref:alcohol dehydrogenase n=1 Tax=Salinisphaera hydrothermalis (strain C41B8) TaxID=1304275 RepID=A0A084IHX4_SALHC|nr:alcohol dehydrogenase [Salinisphaera hydrothermalis C41B8]